MTCFFSASIGFQVKIPASFGRRIAGGWYYAVEFANGRYAYWWNILGNHGR
jgi:hypothetical protein